MKTFGNCRRTLSQWRLYFQTHFHVTSKILMWRRTCSESGSSFHKDDFADVVCLHPNPGKSQLFHSIINSWSITNFAMHRWCSCLILDCLSGWRFIQGVTPGIKKNGPWKWTHTQRKFKVQDRNYLPWCHVQLKALRVREVLVQESPTQTKFINLNLACTAILRLRSINCQFRSRTNNVGHLM